jgi:hypothetical protein
MYCMCTADPHRRFRHALGDDKMTSSPHQEESRSEWPLLLAVQTDAQTKTVFMQQRRGSAQESPSSWLVFEDIVAASMLGLLIVTLPSALARLLGGNRAERRRRVLCGLHVDMQIHGIVIE